MSEESRVEIVPEFIKEHTFAVQYNRNCPSPWLVRLPGRSAVIDMKGYSSFTPKEERTDDALGFGKTFEEAALLAIQDQARIRTVIRRRT